MDLNEKFDLKQLDNWLTRQGFKKIEQLSSDYDYRSYIKRLGDGEMFLLMKFLELLVAEDGFVLKSTIRITLNDKAGYSLAWFDVSPDKTEEIDEAIDQLMQSASDRLQQTLLTIAEYRMTGM